uniref:G-protein coupled receptors family 1 profile domain-containing protein n=1 Tax=Ditylenchus dipsaci TaxID=166011 RepID=A0A915EPQ6_9BILA
MDQSFSRPVFKPSSSSESSKQEPPTPPPYPTIFDVRSNRNVAEICAYCSANGYGQSAMGHNKFNCHRLATLSPCDFCGASGVNNHTKSHCPSKPRVSLRLKESYQYITFSSILIFALPLVLIVIFYYHIINKLREAVKNCKRMRRGASSRAPYQRVTKVVLWVVIFHVICWSPFWLFNLFSSIFRLRISTQFDRIVVNIIHLFPYVNCALNPMLYAVNAENFRTAFRSLFCRHVFSSRGSNRQQSTILEGDGLMQNEDSRSSTYVRRNSGLATSNNTSSERLMNSTINYGVPYPPHPPMDLLPPSSLSPPEYPLNMKEVKPR